MSPLRCFFFSQHAGPAAAAGGGRPRPPSGTSPATTGSAAAAAGGDSSLGLMSGSLGGVGSRLEAALVALGVKIPARGPADPLEPFLSE